MAFAIFLAIIYLIVGFFAGIIGGLLGVGGGVITVPCFVLIFSLLGYSENIVIPLAVGTSLAAMVLNTLSATYSHHQRSAVNWEFLRKMAPGLIIGSMIGAFLDILLPKRILSIFFGFFFCLLSLIFLRKRIPVLNIPDNHRLHMLQMASLLIGALSSLLGIGGGVFTVPLLLSMDIPDNTAIGTSSSTTLLVSLMGTLSYIFLGWNQPLEAFHVGYVNLPAFLLVGITMFSSAPIGVKLVHQLALKQIRLLFGGLLIVTGVTFIILNVFF